MVVIIAIGGCLLSQGVLPSEGGLPSEEGSALWGGSAFWRGGGGVCLLKDCLCQTKIYIQLMEKWNSIKLTPSVAAIQT